MSPRGQKKNWFLHSFLKHIFKPRNASVFLCWLLVSCSCDPHQEVWNFPRADEGEKQVAGLFLMLQTFHRFFQINGQILPGHCLLPVPWFHRHSPRTRTHYWSRSRPYKGFGKDSLTSLCKAEYVAYVTGTFVICPLSK